MWRANVAVDCHLDKSSDTKRVAKGKSQEKYTVAWGRAPVRGSLRASPNNQSQKADSRNNNHQRRTTVPTSPSKTSTGSPDELIILCFPRYGHDLAQNLQTEARTSNDRGPFGWLLNGKETNAFPFAATLAEGSRHIGMIIKSVTPKPHSLLVAPQRFRSY